VAAAAAAEAATALADIAQLRPDTTGIDDFDLRFPSALKGKFPDPADPERQRIEAIAKQLRAYSTQRHQNRAKLEGTLESEYLPEVNPQVRERFHGALARTDDPAHYHQEIRLLGALLSRPQDVIAALAQAPVRTVNDPRSQ
jgi:hypothetical protein